MLAINVSIPNLTVARLEQFRPPRVRIQTAQPTDTGWLKAHHTLYDSLMPLSPVGIHLQLMQTQKLVAMATSLSCRISAISAFCRPTTHTPSITNRLVAIVHTKPVFIALLLLLGGVEPNPGPAADHRHGKPIQFGLLNARSAVRKAASY